MRKTYTNGFVSKHHGKWRANLDYVDELGQRRRVTKATGIKCYSDIKDPVTGDIIKRDNRGKAQAELVLRAWRDKLIESDKRADEQGAESGRSCSGDAPLYDYARSYLENHHAKASTITGYRAALKRLNGTVAGSTPLSRLTAKEIKAWETDMYEDGLCQTTVAHYHAFIAQVIKYAVAVGDIGRSPLGAMRAPRRKLKPVNSLLPQTARDVVECLDALGPTPLSTGALLALACGMRRGEICALRWLDVDLEGGVVHVTHGLTKGRGFRMDTPKDPDGGDVTRDIPIGENVSRRLLARRSAMASSLAGLGMGWSDALFVIGDPLTGSFKSPDVLGNEWRTLSRLKGWTGTQGEVATLHDLRHTFATLCVANGMDIMCLASVLGHRDPSVTLRVYAIALEEPKREGMQRMDELLAGNCH